MNVDERYYLECYKDFIASGLSIAEYAEINRITVDFVNSIVKHGRSTVSLYSVHEAFQNIEKLKLFEIINDDGEYEIFPVVISEEGFKATNDTGLSVCEVSFIDFDYCDKITDCLDLMLQELYSKLLTI